MIAPPNFAARADVILGVSPTLSRGALAIALRTAYEAGLDVAAIACDDYTREAAALMGTPNELKVDATHASVAEHAGPIGKRSGRLRTKSKKPPSPRRDLAAKVFLKLV